MANLFSSIVNLFSKKSKAEKALEKANKLIAEKQKQAKEFAENKVKLEREIENKRQKASEELAKQAQIDKLISKAALSVQEAQAALDIRKAEFNSAVIHIAEESAQIELQLTQAKEATKNRAKDFDEWLNQFDEKKKPTTRLWNTSKVESED
mgnify:CR=1 FL=1